MESREVLRPFENTFWWRLATWKSCNLSDPAAIHGLNLDLDSKGFNTLPFCLTEIMPSLVPLLEHNFLVLFQNHVEPRQR